MQIEPGKNNHTHPTCIGVLINYLDTNFQRPIVNSLLEEAKKLNLSLIFLPGHNLNDKYIFERQFNAAYYFAKSPIIDALISITSSFSNEHSDEEMCVFLRGHEKSIINIGSTLSGIPSILVQNKSGLSQLMHHFIYDHGYTRIAFMKGANENYDAESRFETYKESLAAANLPYDERLVVQGHYTQRHGRVAMETLLARHIPFDALVCANDEMAFAATVVAHQHGLSIPDDFALAGFDDLFSIYKDGPALTTVHQPINAQIKLALHLACNLIQGEMPPLESHIDTHLVIRQSCGCIDTIKNGNPHPDASDSVEVKILKALDIDPHSQSPYIEYVHRLITELSQEDGSLFDSLLNNIVDEILDDSADLSILQSMLLNIQTYLLTPENYTISLLLTLSKRLHSAHIFISNAISTYRLRDDLNVKYNLRKHEGFLRERINQFDQEEVLNLLQQSLINLEIRYCFIATYEKNIEFSSHEKFKPSSYSTILFSQIDHKRRKDLEGCKFETLSIIPNINDLLKDNAPLCWYPIFQHNQHYGYIVFDIHANMKISTALILDEISSTLTSSFLVNELARTHDILRQGIDETARKNQDLSVIAEHDELTGLLNRRGFFYHATKKIEAQENHPILLIFVDLDGLKSINDTYGHIEGDFAIKTASQLLMVSFRTSDIVARLGGDEFIILAPLCSPVDIEKIRSRVYAFFERFNQAGITPYPVRCSLGACSISQENTKSLAAFIEEADHHLYAEKRRRKGQA